MKWTHNVWIIDHIALWYPVVVAGPPDQNGGEEDVC